MEKRNYWIKVNLKRLISKIVAPILFLCLSNSILVGCAGPRPIAEYNRAAQALGAAREHGAAGFSPGYWHKAEEYYRLGEKKFSSYENREAKRFFDLATSFAEKAENATRLKKFQSGEGIP